MKQKFRTFGQSWKVWAFTTMTALAFAVVLAPANW